jgi:membrane-bound lytic murein transglycosylase A
MRHSPAAGVMFWACLSLSGYGFAQFEGQAMTQSPQFETRQIEFAGLPGWRDGKQHEALATFVRSCGILTDDTVPRPFKGAPKPADWIPACKAAATLPGKPTADEARAFFERFFVPVEFALKDSAQSLFTGYFEPELEGTRQRADGYAVPLYRKPDDLIKQRIDPKTGKKLLTPKFGRQTKSGLRPYLTRRQIETGALAGRGLEIAWLKSAIDTFFMHIQGSGRIRLAEGGAMRVVYDAKNGHPYTAIGKVLVENGILTRESVSMQSIKHWLKQDGKRGMGLMRKNKSFIFFREIEITDPGLGPTGAAGVALTPHRSLAVDARFHALGTPLWLASSVPAAKDRHKELNALMIAQDTGSAILGPVRGDYFWGSGAHAGAHAGRMKSQGRLFALWPRKSP